MIRDVPDPRHEAVRKPMGEATEVDGGSLPSAQITFSATDEKKEGDFALPPEEGEDLQDAAARRPSKAPPPLRKLLKIYWGMQPWALSLPDQELCLQEALAVCTPQAPEPSAARGILRLCPESACQTGLPWSSPPA